MQTVLAALSLAAGAALAPAVPNPPQPAPTPRPAVAPCDDAYLGVYVRPGEEGGAEVTRVIAGSPAEEAGLRAGDRIVALDGRAIGDADALIGAIDDRTAGEEVELVLRRGGDKVILTLALGNRAESELALPPSGATLYGGAGTLRGVTVETTPAVEVPEARWIPVGPPEAGAQHEDALQARLDELRARMDERWAELAERLERYREERGHDGAGRERLEDLRHELEASRREQERRMEELREALHESRVQRGGDAPPAGIRWQGPDGVVHEARVPLGVRRVEAPRIPGLPGVLRTATPDAPGPPAASAEEVRALHDDVRALRREIQELKELLRGGR